MRTYSAIPTTTTFTTTNTYGESNYIDSVTSRTATGETFDTGRPGGPSSFATQPTQMRTTNIQNNGNTVIYYLELYDEATQRIANISIECDRLSGVCTIRDEYGNVIAQVENPQLAQQLQQMSDLPGLLLDLGGFNPSPTPAALIFFNPDTYEIIVAITIQGQPHYYRSLISSYFTEFAGPGSISYQERH